jgi:carbamoyltransferase
MYTLGYSGFSRDSRRGLGMRSPLAKTHQGFDNIFSFREGEVPLAMFPLGYFGHDASAAIIRDGKVIACAAEERFTRVKYSLNLAGNTLLPGNAIHYCLEKANVSIDEVDIVAHYCDFRLPVVEKRLALMCPFLSPEDAASVGDSYNRVFSMMMEPGVVYHQFERLVGKKPNRFVPVRHHEAHAASAFFPSGLEEALILTIDGTGELESSLLAIGQGDSITEIERTLLPVSLGTLYLIITVYLGFKSLGDEYKVMGLAAYGNPARFRDVFESLVVLESDGKYSTPLLATSQLKDFLCKKLGPMRSAGEPVEQRHADVAAALQESLHRAVLHLLRHARNQTGLSNLCMAGGVALNCTLNGAIARSGLFENIFVQPAANDEGCSVGAALYVYSQVEVKKPLNGYTWDHVYFGPEYDEQEILSALKRFQDHVYWEREDRIAVKVAKKLAAGNVVGWFQGRMEFGPRALGNRSILADPRDPGMKEKINARVKNRESFRPFAPAVLEECSGSFFDLTGIHKSPFMLFAVPVRDEQRAVIPAVTHVDGSARVQTVSKESNPRFWELLSEFGKSTGVPVVLNTSFNVKNEPIVCTPDDALQCFLSTQIDCLAMGDFFVNKRAAE